MRKTTVRLWFLFLSNSTLRSVVSFRLNFSFIKVKLIQSSVQDDNICIYRRQPVIILLEYMSYTRTGNNSDNSVSINTESYILTSIYCILTLNLTIMQ